MIRITVSENNPTTKTVTIEAHQGNKRILRSPMKYTTYTRKAIEKLIVKACKAFEEPQWGGYDVTWLIEFK